MGLNQCFLFTIDEISHGIKYGFYCYKRTANINCCEYKTVIPPTVLFSNNVRYINAHIWN